ncbi:hypothetical protein D3C84_488530 [compost metagenome]
MTPYILPLRDMQFVVHKLLGAESACTQMTTYLPKLASDLRLVATRAEPKATCAFPEPRDLYPAASMIRLKPSCVAYWHASSAHLLAAQALHFL